ncbi:MAG: hypothetical protein IT303_20250, partial [Dehalococcoidia bacterium]|nr:hypothetical protein [Dehalococcoidia bacterium]
MLREFRESAIALYGEGFVELRARQLPQDAGFPDEPPGVEVTVILRERVTPNDLAVLSGMISRRAWAADVYFELDIRAVPDWDPQGERARCTVKIAA